MKSDCKTACILMDENDLKDFENSYGYVISKECLCVPFDYISMMQVRFYESDGTYYIPKIIEGSEFFIAKRVYIESQKFLKQLLLSNRIVNETEDSFPLEFFWFRLWSCVHRAISFCDDFLNQHTVEEVVLIKRNKFINTGGLLISTASFTDLIEAIFRSKNIEVKIFEHQKCYVKPKTIFYTQRHNLKSLLKNLTRFFCWKTLSIPLPKVKTKITGF